jgi:hypothetical protein
MSLAAVYPVSESPDHATVRAHVLKQGDRRNSIFGISSPALVFAYSLPWFLQGNRNVNCVDRRTVLRYNGRRSVCGGAAPPQPFLRAPKEGGAHAKAFAGFRPPCKQLGMSLYSPYVGRADDYG